MQRTARHVLILGGTTEARRLAGRAGRRSRPARDELARRPGRRPAAARRARCGSAGSGDPRAWPAGCASTRWTRSSTPPILSPTRSVSTRPRPPPPPMFPCSPCAGPAGCRGPGRRLAPGRLAGRGRAAAAALGERVFLTTGRMGLAAFAHLTELWFLVRSVDAPEPPVPAPDGGAARPRPVHAGGRDGAAAAATASMSWSPRTAAAARPPPSSRRRARPASRSSWSAARPPRRTSRWSRTRPKPSSGSTRLSVDGPVGVCRNGSQDQFAGSASA